MPDSLLFFLYSIAVFLVLGTFFLRFLAKRWLSVWLLERYEQPCRKTPVGQYIQKVRKRARVRVMGRCAGWSLLLCACVMFLMHIAYKDKGVPSEIVRHWQASEHMAFKWFSKRVEAVAKKQTSRLRKKQKDSMNKWGRILMFYGSCCLVFVWQFFERTPWPFLLFLFAFTCLLACALFTLVGTRYFEIHPFLRHVRHLVLYQQQKEQLVGNPILGLFILNIPETCQKELAKIEQPDEFVSKALSFFQSCGKLPQLQSSVWSSQPIELLYIAILISTGAITTVLMFRWWGGISHYVTAFMWILFGLFFCAFFIQLWKEVHPCE